MTWDADYRTPELRQQIATTVAAYCGAVSAGYTFVGNTTHDKLEDFIKAAPLATAKGGFVWVGIEDERPRRLGNGTFRVDVRFVVDVLSQRARVGIVDDATANSFRNRLRKAMLKACIEDPTWAASGTPLALTSDPGQCILRTGIKDPWVCHETKFETVYEGYV